ADSNRSPESDITPAADAAMDLTRSVTSDADAPTLRPDADLAAKPGEDTPHTTAPGPGTRTAAADQTVPTHTADGGHVFAVPDDGDTGAPDVHVEEKSEFANSELERRRLIQKMEAEYHITFNSAAGVQAVLEQSPKAADAVKAKITPLPLHLNTLKQLSARASLSDYAPILGGRRKDSSRSSFDQEVTTIGAVRSALSKNAIYFDATGQYFKSRKLFNIYASAHFRVNDGVMRTSTHELAHGLLGYALNDFTKSFWDGVESPWKPFRVEAFSPEVDFEWSISSHLQAHVKFPQQAPRHAKAIADLQRKHPLVLTRLPGESVGSAAQRIVRELSDELPWFIDQVGTWENGRPRLAFGRNRQVLLPRERASTREGTTSR
uniref:hypothetical protein n=1 Tax=Streptomyces violaceorubidus TaxID=284042 RepID=UPI0012FEC91B